MGIEFLILPGIEVGAAGPVIQVFFKIIAENSSLKRSA